jgi:hypothetical protein
MPHLLDAANESPPVEIVVVDYNSPDDCARYMRGVIEGAELADGNMISYRPYAGREHYHMAHARNLTVKASSGDMFVILSADIYPNPGFIQYVRENVTVWAEVSHYYGVIACRRELFDIVRGYDERIEFYGPEDRDLATRIRRYGYEPHSIPHNLITIIPTPNEIKSQGYRLPIGKREMSKRGHLVFEENNRDGVIAANPEGWGEWQ